MISVLRNDNNKKQRIILIPGIKTTGNLYSVLEITDKNSYVSYNAISGLDDA